MAIGCLAGAAALLLGDRVEGIGNCIVTDYDSGHGGEEAIYMSLASCILMLASAVYIIVGSFAQDKPVVEGEKPAKGRAIARSAGFGVTALAVLLAVLIPTYNLAWKGAGLPAASAGPIPSPSTRTTATWTTPPNISSWARTS